jgi:hypothetical protein
MKIKKRGKILVNYHTLDKMVEYNFIRFNLHFYYYYILNFYKSCKNKTYTWSDILDMDKLTIATFIISNKNNLIQIRHFFAPIGLVIFTHEPSKDFKLSIYMYDILHNKILHKLILDYPYNEHQYLPSIDKFGTSYYKNIKLNYIFKILKIYKYKSND